MDPYLNSTREEREALTRRRRERDDTISNREFADAWAIDPHHDPYALDLDDLPICN